MGRVVHAGITLRLAGELSDGHGGRESAREDGVGGERGEGHQTVERCDIYMRRRAEEDQGPATGPRTIMAIKWRWDLDWR